MNKDCKTCDMDAFNAFLKEWKDKGGNWFSGDDWWPDGLRIKDSFQFLMQLPGQCDACYEKYCKNYNAPI